MTKLIEGYETSCKRVIERIAQLNYQRNELRKHGNEKLIEELDLDRRIRLLYTEHSEMREIISYLTSYRRRLESRET